MVALAASPAFPAAAPSVGAIPVYRPALDQQGNERLPIVRPGMVRVPWATHPNGCTYIAPNGSGEFLYVNGGVVFACQFTQNPATQKWDITDWSIWSVHDRAGKFVRTHRHNCSDNCASIIQRQGGGRTEHIHVMSDAGMIPAMLEEIISERKTAERNAVADAESRRTMSAEGRQEALMALVQEVVAQRTPPATAAPPPAPTEHGDQSRKGR